MIHLLIFLMAMLNSVAYSAQLDFIFTSTRYKDSSTTTAVWNSYFGTIHPPLVIDTNSSDGLDTEDRTLDVGNGSDGAFDIDTYSRFSVGGTTTGQIITIDTDTYPSLQFTYFHLKSGWTLRGQGSNPLWIKVLGTFTNDGTIDCSGSAGDSVSSAVTTNAAGGTGRCGGGNGGQGGSSSAAATAGQSGGSNGGSVLNTGGSASANTNASGTFAKGGGGGGGYGSLAGSSGGPAGSGGAAGTCTADNSILKVGTETGGPGGGSGGGGGGAYLFSDAQQSRGGGGGAGGGVIIVTAVGDIVNNGSILATGGAGGGASSALGAGSGGAGGGGTVWMTTVSSFTDSGTINANKGSGGGVTAPGTGTGGNGCEGRTWLIQSTGIAGGTPILETPSSALADVGEVHYSKSAYTAQTTSIDIRNSAPFFESFTLTSSLPGSSTASLLVAQSSDNFVNDDSGFVASSNLTNTQGKRFIKFKIQLQLATSPPAATTAAKVSQVSLQYQGHTESDFQFGPACGQISGPGEGFFWLGILTLIYFSARPKFRRFFWKNQIPRT